MGNNFGPQCVRLGSAHQLRAECTWPIHFSNANHISDDVYHLFHCRICAHIRIDVRKLKFMNARQSLNQPAAPVRISLLYAIRLLPCCQSIFSENFDRQNLISNQLKEITQFYEVHAVIKSTDVVVVVVVIPVWFFFGLHILVLTISLRNVNTNGCVYVCVVGYARLCEPEKLC